MTEEYLIVVQFNEDSGTWDLGWYTEEHGFIPQFCGYTTKQEAELFIPVFFEKLDMEEEFKEMEEFVAERGALGKSDG